MQINKLISYILIGHCCNQYVAQSHESFKGFFVGVKSGYSFGHSHAQRKINKANLPQAQNDKFNISAQSLSGGLLFEYNYAFSYSYIGGAQIHIDWSSLKGKSTHYNFFPSQSITTDFNMKQSYGADLKFGYSLQQILPYAKLGVVTSKWVSHTNGMPFLGQGCKSKNLIGIEFGGGLDYSLTQNIIIGAEFIHARYPSFSYFNQLRSGQILHKIKIKPQNNTISFAFKWRI